MSSGQGNTVAEVGFPGPAVQVVSLFLGVAVVLSVFARFITKYVLAQKFYTEDGFLIAATVSNLTRGRHWIRAGILTGL